MPRSRRATEAADEPEARERILTAALDVFAERGFDGARTRDIAERAGANLGLLTYYYGGKERLWKAAVTRAFEELQADVAEATGPAGGDDAAVWLERAMRQFIRFVARKPEFMRLMNDEAKRDGPRMRWLTDRFVRPMEQAVAPHVARAQRDGVVPPISPVSLRYLVLGAAGLVFSQAPECRYLTGVDPTTPEFAERHADALVELLLGGRRSPPANRAGSARPSRSRRRFGASTGRPG